MDFFKSVFAADPTSPREQRSSPESPQVESDDDGRGADVADAGGGVGNSGSGGDGDGDGDGGGGGSVWRGFMKTFASKSESVIQTYRRDLEEFRTGLKKETEALREAAARAVLDLPGSLEAGASVAQESLESVGHAIDDFGGSVWRGTTDIISQGKEAILAMEAEGGSTDQYASDHGTQNDTASSRRYSRFEAQVLALQSDSNTFSVEPEDSQDFSNWRSGFDLAEKEDEIEKLCSENGTLEGFIEKLVPRMVDYETFWCRYYYRVHKLQQAEDARAKLVKRVIAGKEEEDLSWEVDDDDDDENQEVKKDGKKTESSTEGKGNIVEEKKDETGKVEQKDHMNDKPIGVEKQGEVSQVDNLEASGKKNYEAVTSDEGRTDEPKKVVQKKTMNSEPVGEEKQGEVSQVKNLEASTMKIDGGVTSDAGKTENPEISNVGMNSKLDDKTGQQGETLATVSSVNTKSSIISSQSSVQTEEDLEWDEIENLSDNDEKKPGESSANPLKLDLHKSLNTVDDEDLSWDIEDDD